MKDQFFALLNNYLLISTSCAWFFSQVIKIFTGVFKARKFSLKAALFGSGGMPSSHSATNAALTLSSALKYGLGSPIFAVTLVLMIVVLTDAMGVRLETGKQARAINRLLEKVSPEEREHYTDMIGHTPLQVWCGVALGFAAAVVTYFIMVYGR